MGRAKEIIIRVIASPLANSFIRQHHYSGKVCVNSALHFGAFLDDKLHGVLSFGPSIDKRKTMGLVENTGWNDFLELNRMAMDNYLPPNSESRVISICIRLIRKNAPQVKWILSYADACECGDGTIYRASGFQLTAIKENSDIFLLPGGKKIHSMSIKTNKRLMQQYGNWRKYLDTEFPGWKKLQGFQLRYILLLDKKMKLAVPVIPFSQIKEAGAKMYLGQKER